MGSASLSLYCWRLLTTRLSASSPHMASLMTPSSQPDTGGVKGCLWQAVVSVLPSLPPSLPQGRGGQPTSQRMSHMSRRISPYWCQEEFCSLLWNLANLVPLPEIAHTASWGVTSGRVSGCVGWIRSSLWGISSGISTSISRVTEYHTCMAFPHWGYQHKLCLLLLCLCQYPLNKTPWRVGIVLHLTRHFTAKWAARSSRQLMCICCSWGLHGHTVLYTAPHPISETSVSMVRVELWGIRLLPFHCEKWSFHHSSSSLHGLPCRHHRCGIVLDSWVS